MGLAAGIFLVVIGVAYILWQVHKEHTGLLTAILAVMVCFTIYAYIIPKVLVWLSGIFGEDLRQLMQVIFFTPYIIATAVIAYKLIFVWPDKWHEDSVRESAEIWEEVNRLPLPDEETIIAYKLANKIPLKPENCESYNDAAIHAWRVHEYNKRFKKRHWFTIG